MKPSQWDQLAREALADLDASHLLRRRKIVTSIDPTHVLCGGRHLINFASNNYLGLTHHPRVIDAIERSLRENGAGSGASALISGYGPIHERAEQHIALWKGTQAAVLLPSGYQANHAAVQTLAAVAHKSSRPIRFLLDKLCHASLIDAVGGAGGAMRVFPHNNLQKLGRLLAEADPSELQVVVTESIFSMDGDAADLVGLSKLKEEHAFVLLLDEAHATGVYGPAGNGLAAELALGGASDVTILTLSKSIGCVGGAVCASKTFCDALVNLARAYVYSTSIPAMIAAAADAAIDVMQSEPQLQSRLRATARRVRTGLRSAGFDVADGDSPIVPVVLETESAALNAAEALAQDGILCLAIRPPSVPRGTSRLRITLSAGHTDDEIEKLIGSVTRRLKRAGGACR
jgi:8-amino-7-oxononanoate synthase